MASFAVVWGRHAGGNQNDLDWVVGMLTINAGQMHSSPSAGFSPRPKLTLTFCFYRIGQNTYSRRSDRRARIDYR
jgi:hypothetical protein